MAGVVDALIRAPVLEVPESLPKPETSLKIDIRIQELPAHAREVLPGRRQLHHAAAAAAGRTCWFFLA